MRNILALALVATCTSAFAIDYGPGGGGAIPDGPAADTLGPAFTSDIVISGSGMTITSFNSVTLNGLSHTWAGDLMITITHVQSGLTIDILDRPGRTGAGASGFSGDFTGGAYKFVDSGGTTFPNTGASIAAGTYNRVPNAGAGGSSAANGLLANYNGGSLDGTWRLTIRDGWIGDTGGFQTWSFNADAVPEPASMLVLGGALALVARRRRASK